VVVYKRSEIYRDLTEKKEEIWDNENNPGRRWGG